MEDKTKTLGICYIALIAFSLGCDGLYCMKYQHGSTFLWSWLCSNLRMYDIDLRCMSSSYVQVWVLYHMDLRCILVAMFVYLSHGSALYWSAAMMNFLMSQKYWCIADARLMISDQVDSCLKVITFSFKSLTYRIPLASCFGGHSFIPKSCHQHVIRFQTLVFPSIPNCEAKNIGPDIKFVYENPAPLLPFNQKTVPSSTPPVMCWQ